MSGAVHPYASAAYAQSLADTDHAPLAVPEWGFAVLQRSIPGGGVDAVGCYPLATFAPDADLTAGLARLRNAGLVSVVLVADPVLRPATAALRRAFDIARPFKTHYLCEDPGETRPGEPPAYSKHHRYELRRARATVRRIALADHLAAWTRLYRGLVARHGIRGPAAFSSAAFRRLAQLDGLVAFGAFLDDDLVGCQLWLAGGGRAHSHLAAVDPAGLAARAAYALYDAGIRHFAATGAATIDLGGGAGLRDDPGDGLARFKRGFANRTAPALLCGAILDPARYDALCSGVSGGGESGYFPAYRDPGAGGSGEGAA